MQLILVDKFKISIAISIKLVINLLLLNQSGSAQNI